MTLKSKTLILKLFKILISELLRIKIINQFLIIFISSYIYYSHYLFIFRYKR